MKFEMLTPSRIIAGLTFLLAVVGIIFLFSGLSGGDSFDDKAEYDAAFAGGELPEDAPKLPSCAKDIEVTGTEEAVFSVSFTCASQQERTAFVALIKSGFTWNVFVETERITLQAVVPE